MTQTADPVLDLGEALVSRRVMPPTHRARVPALVLVTRLVTKHPASDERRPDPKSLSAFRPCSKGLERHRTTRPGQHF
jgi:hypothetical protein